MVRSEPLFGEWDDDEFEDMWADEGSEWRITWDDGRSRTTTISSLAYIGTMDPEATVEEV